MRRTLKGMLHSVDLFTGIGGFTLALKGLFKPLLYCDVSPTVRALLKNLMATGKLPRAPVVDDVNNMRDILKTVGKRRVALITAGFPCIGFSVAGNREGFDNQQSALFFQLMKVVAALRPRMVLLENVSEVVTANDGQDLETMSRAFERLGYDFNWTIRSARSVGAPQLRKRWFCLCKLSGAPVRLKVSPVAFDWSPSRMPALVSERKADFAKRYSMLGNAIVPAAARAAFCELFERAPKDYDMVRAFPEILIDPTHFKAHVPSPTPPHKIRLTSFPTPRAQMWRRSYGATARNMRDLPTMALFVKRIGDKVLPRPDASMDVNPRFVEWLMGYPTDHTKIAQ